MTSGAERYGNLRTTHRLSALRAGAGEDKNVADAVFRARDWLLERQHVDGFWLGELEGDTILESEYVLLLTWLGRNRDPIVAECAAYIREQQLPTGGWSLYPGGPLEISGSVKGYWALKIAGDDPHAEHMQRARNAILLAGGAEQVNSFTRYYLALLGIISYRQCPAVPPEIMLLPKWCPFNIYEMSAWSRTIIVPLSLLWAFQPRTELPADQKIDELFLNSPAELPLRMPQPRQLDQMSQPARFPWDGFFYGIDQLWKTCERLRLKPFRERSVRLASKWILRRLERSDGLGAIFPPIIWSVIALRCLGYEESSPQVQGALSELEKLTIRESHTARLEPCKSPVWDTALSIMALREAKVPPHHPQLVQAVNWLLSKEARSKGDWSVNHPQVEPSGWYFEFNNEFYPDVDDTIMVTMALSRCLAGSSQQEWSASLLKDESSRPSADFDLALVIAGTTSHPERVVVDVDRMQPIIAALRRAVKWTLAMQCRNGGWGAFDSDNDREVLTRVPFADHNAMIDPPTADITARVLEMFGRLSLRTQERRFEQALKFVWDEQEDDHSWYGRWGVNYLYGTWQVLVGLTQFGVPTSDARIQAAARWLKEKQQQDGGWGESARSYDDPSQSAIGQTTASQTAWALMGLMAAGEVHSLSVQQGVEFLLRSQTDEGTWNETAFTGTGFPRVFYLRYHLYRHYFPLMALARYAELTNG